MEKVMENFIYYRYFESAMMALGLVPVSYTQLDVYKRQRIYSGWQFTH